MTKKSDLNSFGEALINSARDETVETLEQMLRGTARAPYLQVLCTALGEMAEADQKIVLEVALLMIDKTISRSLSVFEDEKNSFFVGSRAEGKIRDVSDSSDGLSGELYTEDGWVHLFSQKPKSVLTKL